jgi:DNA-binding transcriptional MerR regulator
MEKALPVIPAKRYFTIGEVSELCGVKPYVLRYWEQEFTQLKPMKRRGNRRYYQHHEVLLVRRIRELLYEQGFTISGARNRLSEPLTGRRREDQLRNSEEPERIDGEPDGDDVEPQAARSNGRDPVADEQRVLPPGPGSGEVSIDVLRRELLLIRQLLAS